MGLKYHGQVSLHLHDDCGGNMGGPGDGDRVDKEVADTEV